MPPKFRVGIIGCGIAAQFFHAPAYRLLQDLIEVIAIADPNPENRNLVQAILPNLVKQYTSLETMFETEQVDMADIMLPHNLYADVIPRVAHYCRNILVEKPFARTLQDAQKILASTSGLNFSVVHNYIYGRRYKNALEVIASGKIGTPFMVRLENLNTGMASINPSLTTPWRNQSEGAGRGTFHDHGFHLVYLARALMGSEVIAVSASMGNYYKEGDALDTAVVTLFHENGGMSILLDGKLNNQEPEEVEEVLGTKGTLKINPVTDTMEKFKIDLQNLPRNEVLKNSPYASSTAACIMDFVNSVLTSKKLPVTADEAYRNLYITLAAYESYDQKRVVEIPKNLLI
ncbi:MAG: Gfo/Idh/MocA family oxidoreductase [Candidatus Yanofskybacteria bacterium]|nr:Gfo/Idh/MocA family oxidoreductase [Candidatus Yanofskybacteria bacterium]